MKFPIGVDGANSFRYLYTLDYTDQTVSCIDQSSNTVIATIVLTSSKALRNMFYRPINKSVYVITSNWFDRIDADPASGSFNTVVDSGSYTSNSNLTLASYFPVLDCIGYSLVGGSGLVGFSNGDLVDTSSTLMAAQWKRHFPNRKINRSFNAGNIEQPASGSATPIHLLHKARVLLTTAPTTNDLFQMTNQGQLKFNLKDISSREGISRLGYLNKIGSYITGQRTAAMYIIDLENKAVIYSFTVSPSDRVSHKYCSKDQKIFAYQRINTNVTLSVIDWKTKTDLGDISRSVYKATDENCTRMGLYSPYNGYFYVLGGNTAGTGTVNKVHYYDPGQALGSMYVNSVTVGNSATAPVDYYENCMCMNGIELFEYDDRAY